MDPPPGYVPGWGKLERHTYESNKSRRFSISYDLFEIYFLVHTQTIRYRYAYSISLSLSLSYRYDTIRKLDLYIYSVVYLLYRYLHHTLRYDMIARETGFRVHSIRPIQIADDHTTAQNKSAGERVHGRLVHTHGAYVRINYASDATSGHNDGPIKRKIIIKKNKPWWKKKK